MQGGNIATFSSEKEFVARRGNGVIERPKSFQDLVQAPGRLRFHGAGEFVPQTLLRLDALYQTLGSLAINRPSSLLCQSLGQTGKFLGRRSVGRVERADETLIQQQSQRILHVSNFGSFALRCQWGGDFFHGSVSGCRDGLLDH